MLFATLLATLCLGDARAEVRSEPLPNVAKPFYSLATLPALIYLSLQATRPAPVSRPVTCPRHTKPRADCTPVSHP